MWQIGAMVCLLAANRESNCSLRRAMDGRIVCCGIISSCQSAATLEIVTALLATSSSHVKSDTANTGLYLLPLPFMSNKRRWPDFSGDANSFMDFGSPRVLYYRIYKVCKPRHKQRG